MDRNGEHMRGNRWQERAETAEARVREMEKEMSTRQINMKEGEQLRISFGTRNIFVIANQSGLHIHQGSYLDSPKAISQPNMLPAKMALFLDWLFEAATADDVTSDDIHAAAEKLSLIRRQSID